MSNGTQNGRVADLAEYLIGQGLVATRELPYDGQLFVGLVRDRGVLADWEKLAPEAKLFFERRVPDISARWDSLSSTQRGALVGLYLNMNARVQRLDEAIRRLAEQELAEADAGPGEAAASFDSSLSRGHRERQEQEDVFSIDEVRGGNALVVTTPVDFGYVREDEIEEGSLSGLGQDFEAEGDFETATATPVATPTAATPTLLPQRVVARPSTTRAPITFTAEQQERMKNAAAVQQLVRSERTVKAQELMAEIAANRAARQPVRTKLAEQGLISPVSAFAEPPQQADIGQWIGKNWWLLAAAGVALFMFFKPGMRKETKHVPHQR